MNKKLSEPELRKVMMRKADPNNPGAWVYYSIVGRKDDPALFEGRIAIWEKKGYEIWLDSNEPEKFTHRIPKPFSGKLESNIGHQRYDRELDTE